MLTRDKEQILLNELHVLCIEAADHGEAAASKPCIADMESVFLNAAREYRDVAAALAEHIRAHDDQPKMPDADRESLSLLFTAIKARLALSERHALIGDQIDMAEKLCQGINTALQWNWPQEVGELLKILLINASSLQHVLRKEE